MASEISTMNCNVCELRLAAPLYESAGNSSITTMLEEHPGKTRVYYCPRCGHLQTPQLADLEAYYDKRYKILHESEEQDQLYEVEGERKVFRLEHQARTLLSKLAIPAGANLLDYGCAKGATLKRVQAERPDIRVSLFDVSDTYVPFWKNFLPPECWAVYAPKPEWAAKFDVVTSFFALEHVADPRGMLKTVAGLLRAGGVFYCIVPNVYSNIADFVVADHVNHFSAASLKYLFSEAGLGSIEIDETSHQAAWVITGRKAEAPPSFGAIEDMTRPLHERVTAIAEFWRSFGRRVQEFEREHAAEPAAVYGAGFYGNFIATCLNDRDSLACFVDRDPFRQGKLLWGKRIVSPESLPTSVRVVYVGLNPIRAVGEIQKLPDWADRSLAYYYP